MSEPLNMFEPLDMFKPLVMFDPLNTYDLLNTFDPFYMFEHVNRFGIWGAAAYGEFFPLESLPVRSPVISDHQKSFYQMTPTVMLIVLLILLYLTSHPSLQAWRTSS